MPDLVTARWTQSYSVEIPGQGTIAPGGTAKIPEAEARESANWEPAATTPAAPTAIPAPKPTAKDEE